jgi:hypothetical protein
VNILQPELVSALERVPRGAAQRRPGDPVLVRAEAKLADSSPSLIFEVKVPGGPNGADLFVQPPDDVYLPMTKKVGEAAPDAVMFRIDLAPGDETSRLKGATIKLSLIGSQGASEASWKVE